MLKVFYVIFALCGRSESRVADVHAVHLPSFTAQVVAAGGVITKVEPVR
jgi:hypothetical protein